MQKKLLISLFLILNAANCFASLDFTNNALGVRPAGMGGAFTALADGPEAIFYNYASLPKANQLAIKIEKGTLLETDYYAVCAENVFNLNFLRMGYVLGTDGNIPYTSLDSNGYPQNLGTSFGYSSQSGYVSAATQFEGYQLGIGTQLYLENLEKATAKAVNIGAAVQKSFKLWDHDFTAALVGKNLYSTGVIWSTGHKDMPPITIITGLSYSTPSRDINLALDLSNDFSILTNNSLQPKYRLGFEWWFYGKDSESAFIFRGGLSNNDYTLGCSLYFEGGQMFDFAYDLPNRSYLEQTMRFSLGWNFNGLPFKSDHQKSDDLEFKPLTNLADRDKFIALDNKHDKFLKVSTRNIDLSDQHENRDKMYMQLDQLVPRQKIALPTVNRAAMLMPTVNMQEQISTQFGNKANDFSFMLSGRIKLDNQARKITFDLNGFKKIEKITLNDQELSNNSGHFIYEYPLGDKLPEQLEFKVYSAYPVFTLNLKPVQNGFIVSGAIPAVYQLSLDSNMFASQAGKTLNYSYKSSGAELDLMLFSR